MSPRSQQIPSESCWTGSYPGAGAGAAHRRASAVESYATQVRIARIPGRGRLEQRHVTRHPSCHPLPGHESRWPSVIALLAAIGAYVVLPARVLAGPRLLVPALELALLVPLIAANPKRIHQDTRDVRILSVVLIGVVNAVNVVTLVLLIRSLFEGGQGNGQELIRAAVPIWSTMVIVFGLWYWELDRGGPLARASQARPPDLLFPQMTFPDLLGDDHWAPAFVDYLYVSFTNCTAFSPTDTMPLTARIKLLMMVQAAASLITIALVAARGVNVLGG